MLNIQSLHEILFERVEEERENSLKSDREFLFVLRKSDKGKRLQNRYWFYGNDEHIALSFWNGFDSKNRTPNIYFEIKKDGITKLNISTRDSIDKSKIIEQFFVKPLELERKNEYYFSKTYKSVDYLDSFDKFLRNDKVIIDNIIGEAKWLTSEEDQTNQIKFLDKDEFITDYNNVIEYRNKQGLKYLPVSVTAINITNFDPITDAGISKIPKSCPFIFLVGENGSGKTSILKAIAVALSNPDLLIDLPLPNSPWLINYSINIKNKIIRHKKDFTLGEKKALIIPFAAYGPTRLITDLRENRQVLNEFGKDKRTQLYSLFFPDGILKDIHRWLIQGKEEILSNKLSKSELNNRYTLIVRMLIEIIPNVYDIREIDFNSKKEVLYYEEDIENKRFEKGVSFEHLSSGIKSLLAFLGDMMLRLFEQQNDISDPAKLEGIVLIDEIDIHLHPIWQKRLPQILCEYFPRIQFIATTHSPIPLLGAPRNSLIYKTFRVVGQDVVISPLDKIDFTRLLPNSLFTSSIFDLTDITSVEIEDSNQVRTEDSIDEIKITSKIRQQLKDISDKLKDN